MSDPVITVQQVGKRFTLRRRGGRTLKSAVLECLRPRPGARDFWALRDVSFTVAAGDTVGIIGANGAGKSTLLSLIAGTTNSTEGRIATRGRVSSLLELGAGFHPELSGRENVFLYGAIMGLTQAQMRARFDHIVEFAELRDWVDQPVKHYSSGMYVRLAFAVAIEVDPDILIIDEVLSVGDEAFQKKCLVRIADFKRRGKTLLVVSHDLGTIAAISDRILLIDRGRLVAQGAPDQVVAQYRQLFNRDVKHLAGEEWGTGEIKLTDVQFVDSRGQVTDRVRFGEPLDMIIRYQAARRVADPVFGFAISNTGNQLIYGNNTQIDNFHVPFVEGAGALRLRIERIAMSRGRYFFSFSCHSQDHRVNYHRLDRVFPITVETDLRFEGSCHMPIQWARE